MIPNSPGKEGMEGEGKGSFLAFFSFLLLILLEVRTSKGKLKGLLKEKVQEEGMGRHASLDEITVVKKYSFSEVEIRHSVGGMEVW